VCPIRRTSDVLCKVAMIHGSKEYFMVMDMGVKEIRTLTFHALHA
jgi:hypothetical protein